MLILPPHHLFVTPGTSNADELALSLVLLQFKYEEFLLAPIKSHAFLLSVYTCAYVFIIEASLFVFEAHWTLQKDESAFGYVVV